MPGTKPPEPDPQPDLLVTRRMALATEGVQAFGQSQRCYVPALLYRTPIRLVGLASFPSSDRGTGRILDLVARGIVLIHQSCKPCASTNPAVRSGVAREKVAFNGMTQEQGGRVSIPVPMSGRSRVGIRNLIVRDRQDALDAGEVNKGKSWRKSFSATALNLLLNARFLQRDFLLTLSCPLSHSQIRSPTSHALPRKNAFLHHPTFGRSFGNSLCCQCPCQYHLPCIEGPECF